MKPGASLNDPVPRMDCVLAFVIEYAKTGRARDRERPDGEKVAPVEAAKDWIGSTSRKS